MWYHLCNLKNMKNTYGGVLLLVLKVTLFYGCFSRFLNCTSGTKSHNASHVHSCFPSQQYHGKIYRRASNSNKETSKELKNLPDELISEENCQTKISRKVEHQRKQKSIISLQVNDYHKTYIDI